MPRVHAPWRGGIHVAATTVRTFSMFVCQEVATPVLQEQLMASHGLYNIMVKQQ